MPTKRIPERVPVGDAFSGMLLNVDGVHLLSTADATNNADNTSTTSTIHSGDMTVRYGIAYLGKPHLALVPAILALDYGEMLNGEEALEFILKKSNLYPRADVVGYRNDGVDEMIALKWLDLALPVRVLVYANEKAIKPLARVQALIAPPSATVAPRIATYLPRYDTPATWQKDQNS